MVLWVFKVGLGSIIDIFFFKKRLGFEYSRVSFRYLGEILVAGCEIEFIEVFCFSLESRVWDRSLCEDRLFMVVILGDRCGR